MADAMGNDWRMIGPTLAELARRSRPIVAVAERVLNRQMSSRKVEAFRKAHLAKPAQRMWWGACLEESPRSRARVAGLLGGRYPDHFVNLLWPDSETSWDHVAARDMARVLLEEKLTSPPAFVALLGKRVCDAFSFVGSFGFNVRPGDWTELPSGVVLAALPHPSGRSRFWNDAGRAKELQSRLERVLAKFVDKK